MLDRIFGGTAAGANTGLLLQKFRITRGPKHFIDRGWHVVVGEIERVGPTYPLAGLRLRVMGEICRRSRKRFSACVNSNDHCRVLARRSGGYP